MLSALLVVLAAVADAGMPVPTPAQPQVSPPTILPAALCAELRAPKVPPAVVEQAQLDAERKSLEKLAAELARQRKALKAEIARLEKLTAAASAAQKAPPPPPAPVAAPVVPEPVPDAEQLKVLAKTVKAMKPVEAAELLAKMKPALATQVLRNLSPRATASVVAKMKPEMAAQLMAALATPAGGAP